MTKKNLQEHRMRDLAIYGAGGFGRETALMIEQINENRKCWNITGFYDDKITRGVQIDGYPVLGGLTEVQKLQASSSLVVAVADPFLRMSIVDRLKDHRFDFPVLIHPQAMTGSRSNKFGRGSIITAGSIFTTAISLGDFCIINLVTTLGHDVRIGEYTTIMPGCNISGNVAIGMLSMIGTGVQVLQNLTLGNNCKVGAGAVVTKNFGDSVTLVGIPASQIR